MEILEHELVGKTGKLTTCEDAWTATKHFACVIDGATTKGDMTFGMQTTGKMASLLLKEAIKTLPPEATCQEATDYFTQFIAQFCKDRGLYATMIDKHWNRLAASMAIYSVYRQEVWIIGDCQCMIDGEVHTVEKEIDGILAALRSSYIEALLKTGTTLDELKQHDLGRDFILPMLKSQSKYQNSQTEHPYNYTVIDGFEINPVGVKIIPTQPNTEIILASDGYPKLFSSLQATEDYLAHIIENDPLCYQIHPATKGLQGENISFDDRVYLKIKAIAE